MIIDANVYWFPESLFENDDLMDRFLSDIQGDTVGYMKTENGRKRIVIERPAGCPVVDYIQGQYEFDTIMTALDEAGIDKAVLKIPCCQEWMSLDNCRMFNDGMAACQKQSEGRLMALAVVPPYGSKESLDELERCKTGLGMHGVQLSAHYGGKYLDDPAFAPFFERLNEYAFTVYVHHTPLPVQYDCLVDYNNLRRSYGRCSDQTIAVARELFGGMFERYPQVKLVHSMLGGGFFAFASLLFPDKAPDTAGRFDNGDDRVRGWLQNNVFFELSHAQPWGVAQLECAVKVLGAEQIVYGSSYPVRKEWLTDGADFVRALNITEREKELILYGNAKRLYHA